MTADPEDYVKLRLAAETFIDFQQTRIAAENRYARSPAAGSPDFAELLGVLLESEKKVQLVLVREYRRVVPELVRDWQKETRGVGEHLLARLLGHIGHPQQTIKHHWEGEGAGRVLVVDGPYRRRVSDLWSYCGHGDPKRRRARGMSAEDTAALGNPTAKSLVHLLAESCVKQIGTETRPASPYRLLYEQTRDKLADAVHKDVCVRCGPSGKPAQPGSPLSKAHQHNDALRRVGKELLRDLWVVAGPAEPTVRCQECGNPIPAGARPDNAAHKRSCPRYVPRAEHRRASRAGFLAATGTDD